MLITHSQAYILTCAVLKLSSMCCTHERRKVLKSFTHTHYNGNRTHTRIYTTNSQHIKTMTASAFVSIGATALNSSSFTSTAVCSRHPTSTRPQWTMAKNAKFGPFTPAVLAGKLVLGEKQLNKIRGKSIKLHAQVIVEFCKATGADSKTRMALIQTAKQNGNTLGFLY